MPQAKSLYISRALSNFYGTEFEIWADFVILGRLTVLENGTTKAIILKAVFLCFGGHFF